MPEDRVNPRFKYYRYQDRQFASQEELDKLLALLLKPETSWWAKAITALQIAAAVAVMWMRDRNISRTMELEKQGYMVLRSQANADELAADPLDVEHRPTV